MPNAVCYKIREWMVCKFYILIDQITIKVPRSSLPYLYFTLTVLFKESRTKSIGC